MSWLIITIIFIWSSIGIYTLYLDNTAIKRQSKLYNRHVAEMKFISTLKKLGIHVNPEVHKLRRLKQIFEERMINVS